MCCESLYCGECALFLRDVQSIVRQGTGRKHSYNEDRTVRLDELEKIVHTYIEEDSNLCVNISGVLRTRIMEAMVAARKNNSDLPQLIKALSDTADAVKMLLRFSHVLKVFNESTELRELNAKRFAMAQISIATVLPTSQPHLHRTTKDRDGHALPPNS
eukprot:CFRG2748T1